MMIRIWLLAALSFALSSCASYHAGFKGRALPGGYTLLAIPVFKNMTSETGTEVDFTNAIIGEFSRSNIAKIVDKTDAQATLEGSIVSITYTPTNQIQTSTQNSLPNNTILTTSYRVTVITRLVLRRNSDQKELWSNSFTLERVYYAPQVLSASLNSVDSLYNNSARYQTLAGLAKDMMAEAHDRLTENSW